MGRCSKEAWGTQWEVVVRVHWGRAHEDQRKRKVAKPVACYTCRLTKHYQKTLHEARDNIAKAQERQKQQYDSKHNSKTKLKVRRLQCNKISIPSELYNTVRDKANYFVTI